MSSWDDTAPPAWDDAPSEPEPRYAGFWIRVAATIIDFIVFGIPVAVILALLGVTDESSSAGQGVELVIGALYSILLWVNWGATVGGRILGLKLVRVDGQPVTYGTAVVRYLMLIVSFAALLVGVIWVAFAKKKQGWMDIVAGTYVIRV